jgi:broad specificity phosphatase PhoE
MVIYFLRHGSPRIPTDEQGRQLVYGPNALLSHEGAAEAMRMGWLIGPVDVVLCSPFKRTMETANILAYTKKAELIPDDRLRDTDCTWEGVPMDEFLAVFNRGEVFSDPRTHETLDQLGSRMMEVYQHILTKYSDKQVAVVGHGDPIRALYWRLTRSGEAFPPYSELTEYFTMTRDCACWQVTPRDSGIESRLLHYEG